MSVLVIPIDNRTAVLSRTANFILLALLVAWGFPKNSMAQSSYSWNGTSGGNWMDSANWNPSDGFPDGVGDIAVFTSRPLTTLTWSGTITLGALTLNGTPTGNVGLGNASESTDILLLRQSDGSSPILTNSSGRSLVILANLIGQDGFTKSGTGTLTFRYNPAEMDLSGTIFLNGGTTIIDNARSLGTGNVTFTGNATLTSHFTSPSSSIITHNSNRTISVNAGITATLTNGGASTQTEIEGSLSGEGNFIFSGAVGNFTLKGINSYSGSTTISGAKLFLIGSNLSTGALVLSGNNSILDLGGASQLVSTLSLPSTGSTALFSTITNGLLTISGTSNQDFVARPDGSITDLSGLASFTFNNPAQNFNVSTGTGNATNTLILSAVANTITANSTNFGGASTASGAMNVVNVELGATNIIRTNSLRVGGSNSTANLYFQSGISNRTLTIRGVDGANSLKSWIIGETTNGGVSGQGSVNLGTGAIDALVGNLSIGRHIVSGSNSDSSSFTMSSGTLNAESIVLAEKIVGGTPTLNSTFNQTGGNVTASSITFGQGGTGLAILLPSYNIVSGTLAATTIAAGRNGTYATNSSRNLNISGNATLANISGSNLTILGASNNAGGLMRININGSSNLLASNGDIIFSTNSTLSGSGNLAKNGSGNLILAGTSNFTGTTTINSGAVVLGANQTLGAIAGSGNLTLGSYTLTTNSSSSTIFSGIISGSGSLTKNGSGTLSLGGENSYNGATTVNAGTLAVTGNISTSALTLNSGGVISAGSATAVDKFSAASLTIQGGSGYAFTIGNISGGTAGIAGADYDLIDISGTLEFNNTLANPFIVYLRGTPTNWSSSGNYTWNIMAASSINGFSSSNFVADTSNFGGALSGAASWTFGTSGSNLTLTYGASGAPTWSGGSGNWSENFSPGLSNNLNILFTGNGGTAMNDISAATLSALGSITFSSTAGAYTLAANPGSAGNGTALSVSVSIINNSLNTQTINTALNFSASRSIDAAAGGIAIGGVISGAGGFAKNGSNILTLTGNNSFTGDTAINTGTVEIGSPGRLGGGNYTGSISNSGVLIYSGTNNQTLSGIISGTGSLTLNASSRLILSGDNSYSGDTTINTGTVEIGSLGRLGGGNYTGSISNNGVLIYSGTNNQTLSGVISGAGALTQNASSRLTLSANNTFTGNTTITAGTVEIGSSGRLGAGNYSGNISNNGVLIYSGTNNQTLSGVISGAGALTQNASSRLTLSANNTYTGDTTINTGIFEITTTGGLGGRNYSGNISNSGSFVFGSNSNQTLSGAISGSGAITKNGSSTLTLSGNNSYSGSTIINTGTFVIGHANAVGSGTVTQSSGASVLKIDTAGTIMNVMSVYNVFATQSANLSGAITVNNATWDIDSGYTLTINGSVSGAGGVTKNGGGTLILSGSNSYSAATTINSGTLNAANANALGSNNAVIVNDGTLLVTAGNAINNKNIQMGGSGVGLRFSGNYTGAIGALTLSTNSALDLGHGSVAILLQGLALNSYFLDIYNWTGTTLWDGGNGNDTDKFYVGPDLSDEALARISFYSDDYGTDSFLGTGFDLGLRQTSWDSGLSGYYIIPVPEPETWAAASLLVLICSFWIWKKARA